MVTDGRVQVVTDTVRSIESDLAEVARHYTKFCVKLTGQDIPQSTPGEDTCTVLWDLVDRKYGLKFTQADRSQVRLLPFCCSRFLLRFHFQISSYFF